jgi:phenylalanine-4-hydroxylase
MGIRAALEKIPDHLLPFIAHQDASLYTPIDHASWRYILRVSRSFFAQNAHQKYLDGLRETGISTERIPLIEEMDACLRRFGWRAVPVSGFIPPAVFMEFQALGVLPIACEMRTLEHLAYTPAPDIVHEAAGHAPIIADPEYSAYLRNYGEVARRAIFSNHDMAVYQAVRELSDAKEDPRATPERIETLQLKLDQEVARQDYLSEATLLARMNWWTVEYGLIGSPNDPKIYGAGLLSSVGESYHCLSSQVRKIPFTLGCIDVAYDITRPQPQLFVTPDFASLTRVLEEYAATMAFRLGGTEGLAKAKRAQALTTTVLDSGLQISGVLEEFEDESYLRFRGPVQLALDDREIAGHGAGHHPEGYSTPLGPLSDGRELSKLSRTEIESAGKLRFASGIELEGALKNIFSHHGKNLILSFEKCTVRRDAEVLYRPAWGSFDLACGTKVDSVFGGAADRPAYLAATGGYHQTPRSPKTNLTERNRELNELYARVRQAREGKLSATALRQEIDSVLAQLDRDYPSDWLLRLECLELGRNEKLAADLQRIATEDPHSRELIQRGLELL